MRRSLICDVSPCVPLALWAAASTQAFVVQSPLSRASTSLAVAIDTSDIKNGLTIELEGEPHKVCSNMAS